ncbi:hypothetical protein THRCLA_22208, partial [Thraustotheca clavata]
MSKEEDPEAPYEILGLSPLADEDAVKKAFRKMSLKHHPDKGGDANKFHELQIAAKFLMDPNKKKKYDEKLSKISAAQAQRMARDAALSDARKAMVEKLHKAEDLAGPRKKPKHFTDELKQRSRQRMQEYVEKRDKEVRDRAETLGESKNDAKQRTIRVKWSNSKASHSDQTLVNSFRKYGHIKLVKMKTSSAQIVFSEMTAALAAAQGEGHNAELWKEVTLVGHAIPTPMPMA